MIALIAHYWFGLLLSALIGLATAWWAWGYRPAAPVDPVYEDEPIEWPPQEPARQASDSEAPPAWALAVAEGRDGASERVDAAPVPPPAPVTAQGPDDLMMIKGIGPQIDALLRSMGISRFAQIAGWMPEDIERVDASLGEFRGRIIRDEWIAQARLLAAGDMATFNQRYGHL